MSDPSPSPIEAYRKHRETAHKAFAIYRQLCGGIAPPRVPGMDTAIRLAWRIDHGRTIAEAAAREYVYRWHLAIRAPDQMRWGIRGRDHPLDCPVGTEACSIFGTPHPIGM